MKKINLKSNLLIKLFGKKEENVTINEVAIAEYKESILIKIENWFKRNFNK